MTPTFLSVVFRPDPICINILGLAKDLFTRFRDAPTLEKMLGVGPSMRFFGLGFSGARFRASRSRVYISMWIVRSSCVSRDFPCDCHQSMPLLSRGLAKMAINSMAFSKFSMSRPCCWAYINTFWWLLSLCFYSSVQRHFTYIVVFACFALSCDFISLKDTFCLFRSCFLFVCSETLFV